MIKTMTMLQKTLKTYSLAGDYDLLIETPEVMRSDDRKVSRSAFRCPGCDKPPSKGEQVALTDSDIIRCPACGEYYCAATSRVLVGYGSQKFLDLDEVYQSFWWHGTFQKDWPDSPMNDDPRSMVHVGTYNAALGRATALRREFLYKLKLSPKANLGEDFLRDIGDWRVDVNDYKGFNGFRYVNRWESPGSISIILDPSFVQVVDVRRVVC